MFPFYSFLQAALQFVRGFFAPVVQTAKWMYRSSAVITSGCMVIAIVVFSSAGFGAGGKSALTVFAEGRFQESGQALEKLEAEETDLITEAKIQAEFTAFKQESRIIGQSLIEDTIRKQQKSEEAKAELAVKQQEIQEEKEAQARKLEEETARKEAEETARKKVEQEKRDVRQIPYSQSDYQVLLKIVQAEAGICDEKGRILVANVIMNRVESDEFPDSITEVVYEKGQFSPVIDGRINSVKVTDSTVECVNRALAGEDYSQGALYFMNRRGSQAGAVRFFDGKLTYLFSHDGHEFFK